MKLENSRWAAILNPALRLFFNDQLEILLASFVKTCESTLVVPN
jgi:hypothetical protein